MSKLQRPWQLKITLVLLTAAAVVKIAGLYQIYGFSSPHIIIALPLGIALFVALLAGLWIGNARSRSLVQLICAFNLLHMVLSAFSSSGSFHLTPTSAASIFFVVSVILLLSSRSVKEFRAKG